MPTPFVLNDPNTVLLFKKKYAKYEQNVLNRSNPTLGKIKKAQDMVGDEWLKTIDIGWIGGAGMARIPVANRGRQLRASLETKQAYITTEIDRRTVKQSKDPGSFVEGQKHMVQKTLEKFQWLRSCNLWSPNGTGSLGTIATSGVVDNGGGSYTLTISDATYQRARFVVRDLVNIGSGSTDLFEIMDHRPADKEIDVTRVSGSTVPAQADVIFLQGSENASVYSIPQVVKATAGSSLYGTTVADGFESFRVNAGGAGISVDLMNEVALGVHENCGKSPDLIATSYTLFRKLLALLEDQKRYFTQGETKNRVGDFSFKAVQFMSVDGPVPIVIDRFIQDDEMYFLNTDYITEHAAPDCPGWVDDDTGSIWLRKAGADQFEARYASYYNNFILPNHQGLISNVGV